MSLLNFQIFRNSLDHLLEALKDVQDNGISNTTESRESYIRAQALFFGAFSPEEIEGFFRSYPDLKTFFNNSPERWDMSEIDEAITMCQDIVDGRRPQGYVAS